MQIDNLALVAQVEELAKLLKPWSEQLIIGGGVALILYDTVLAKSNAGAVGTTDIDYLIPRKLIKVGSESISEILVNHGYELKNKSLSQPAVQSFIKQFNDVEIEVEFLTDDKSRQKEDVVVIEAAGIHAQPLSYIEMSLQEATPVRLDNGLTILLVKPEAWVFHKGLTFTKRTNQLKQYKDLYGIWFVLTQLNKISLATERALPKLMEKYPPGWKQTFRKNLSGWIKNASPRDWDLLADQDVNGALSKTGFLGALQTIGIRAL